jgi:nitrogen regulatory protein P-II 1
MKKIEAIMRSCKLEDVKATLVDLHIEGMTVTEVKGVGGQNSHTEMYRGNTYIVKCQPQIKVEVVLDDDRLDETVAAIVRAGKLGRMGSGELYVSNVEDAIRIRTQETGAAAI